MIQGCGDSIEQCQGLALVVGVFKKTKMTDAMHRSADIISSTPDTNDGPSAVMANDENPDSITDDTEQEMIREALQVHAPDIALADREGLRSLRGQLYECRSSA